MATAPVWPVQVSMAGKPTRMGGPPGSPPRLIMPLVAWTMLSIAG